MGYYINSENVKVFPAVRRGVNDRSSQMMYEGNIANLTRQIQPNMNGFKIGPHLGIVKSGYINARLNEDTGKREIYISGSQPLEFNINGRYFKLESGTVLFEIDADKYTPFPLYASIRWDTDTEELIGQDESGKYTGLLISDKYSVDGHTRSLALFGDVQWTGERLIYSVDPRGYGVTEAENLNIKIIDGKRDI